MSATRKVITYSPEKFTGIPKSRVQDIPKLPDQEWTIRIERFLWGPYHIGYRSVEHALSSLRALPDYVLSSTVRARQKPWSTLFTIYDTPGIEYCFFTKRNLLSAGFDVSTLELSIPSERISYPDYTHHPVTTGSNIGHLLGYWWGMRGILASLKEGLSSRAIKKGAPPSNEYRDQPLLIQEAVEDLMRWHAEELRIAEINFHSKTITELTGFKSDLTNFLHQIAKPTRFLDENNQFSLF